jgi:translocation and assembly module TamA
LRYGAGVGLRYHTDFGPIRFDVAVPLDRREADNAFELYISIGQAF